MKTILTAAAMLVILLAACGKSDEAKDLRDELAETKRATSDYVDKTLSEWKGDLSTFDEDIRRLKEEAGAKAGEMGDDARQELDAAIAKLELQRKALNAKLTEAREYSGESWDKFEAEFKSTWSDLKQSFDDLKKSMN